MILIVVLYANHFFMDIQGIKFSMSWFLIELNFNFTFVKVSDTIFITQTNK